ncbi:LuxR C-terminal-related transcriptional regulator [Actinoplanes sp. NPDC051343]|uniref:helix-turn-helix transcriptional regulator n=1 Tax=Actinoplanes sp. NPDC051343 TaxID=3363906 RepID=UPI00378F6C22
MTTELSSGDSGLGQHAVVAREVLDELLPERMELLRTATGMPLVGAALRAVSIDRLVLERLTGTVGDALRGLVVESGAGLGGRVWQGRMPLRVDDYIGSGAITHEYDAAARAEFLTAAFAVPVLVWGDVLAVLYGAVRDRRPVGDTTLVAATVVASKLGRDAEERLMPYIDDANRPSRALAELTQVIRDVADPSLQARLNRIRRGLMGQAVPVLSGREADMLRLVEAGASTLEIAARLGVHPETAKNYLRSAAQKLEVDTRGAAARQARLNGLL